MTRSRSNFIALTGRVRQGRFRRAKALRRCGIYREAVTHYSPGLQPWVSRLPIGALKVAPDVSATDGINTLRPEQPPRSPLSGRFNCPPDPGLKPWAMLYSRSAAKSDRQLAVLLDQFMVRLTRPRSFVAANRSPLTDHQSLITSPNALSCLTV
jgi:hypothetical protein